MKHRRFSEAELADITALLAVGGRVPHGVLKALALKYNRDYGSMSKKVSYMRYLATRPAPPENYAEKITRLRAEHDAKHGRGTK